MEYFEVVNSRTYWKGLAEEATNLLRILEQAQPGITSGQLAALDQRHADLVKLEGAG